MVPNTGEETPLLADILTEFAAIIARLDGDFSDVTKLAEVEDDLLRLVSSARKMGALDPTDAAHAELLATLLAQYERASAQLDVRLGAMRAFGVYLKANVDA